KYWDLIGSDLCEAVVYFFVKGSFPKGCNSSFIALIPKVLDAKFVSDFRHISLIGCVYKVVTKILANRLMKVVSDLVSDTQSAFVAGRQILDGPFILDELLQCWMRGSLNSAKASILVNESPSNEFSFHCGRKQGDPLAPYLFILIMESLHLSFRRVVDNGLRINIQKSQLLGVGVSRQVIEQAASSIGCPLCKINSVI
nr:RNA-directed DNA polymerase, eukaryota, reverse transcriptase zinc-binding domain protein [Tanacetum cinerariifolium]